MRMRINLVKYCTVEVEKNKLKRVPGRAPNYLKKCWVLSSGTAASRFLAKFSQNFRNFRQFKFVSTQVGETSSDLRMI